MSLLRCGLNSVAHENAQLNSKLGVENWLLRHLRQIFVYIQAMKPRPLPFVDQLLEKLIEHGWVGLPLGGFHDGAL